jgi:putative FmdB family regulatory protein
MPFYEYECSACGAQVEVLQKITDAPLKKCTECGRNQLKKLVSAPVFRLKGGGWYETDFKSDQDKKRNLVDNDRDGGGDTSESKSDDSASSGSSSAAKKESPAKVSTGKAAAAKKPAAKPVAKPRAKARPAAKPKAKAKSRGK